MCLSDLMRRLGDQCVDVTVAQVRWAITTGKVQRPSLDGSLRFNYEEVHVNELIRYFGQANRLSTVESVRPGRNAGNKGYELDG